EFRSVLFRSGRNPARAGAFALLRRMGADVRTEGVRDQAGEPRGDLIVRAARLHGTTIAPDEGPGGSDALPWLAVPAALADGETRITGAAELRLKESDRLAALEQLAVLGVTVRALPDGLVVEGVGGGAGPG